MRMGKGVAVGFLLAAMCGTTANPEMPPLGGRGSTYSTWVREDLPSPAGTGDAPFAGSLGPPRQMVEPAFPGIATRTREGSSGPPIRLATEAGGPVDIGLTGPNHDAWRGRRLPGGRVAPGGKEPQPGEAPSNGQPAHGEGE